MVGQSELPTLPISVIVALSKATSPSTTCSISFNGIEEANELEIGNCVRTKVKKYRNNWEYRNKQFPPSYLIFLIPTIINGITIAHENGVMFRFIMQRDY
jgi:hypothetical protein